MKKIYILHGWTYNFDKWVLLNRSLSKKGVQTEILKIPGLTAPLDKPYMIKDYVNWLYKKLKTNKEKVILMGGSNGGRICLNFAVLHPELIQHLVLIDSAGIYQSNKIYRLKNFIFKIVAKIGKIFLRSQKLKVLLYKMNRTNDYLLASEVMKKTLINLINSDRNLDLKKINVPTTIIWGENDQTTPLWMGKKMHNSIENSRLFVIQGARHSPQFTHTNEVVNIILKELL